MKTFVVVVVFLLALQASAMQTILPRDVLQQLLIPRPEQEFTQWADAIKILRHNGKHTKQYVVALLTSLQGKPLTVKLAEDSALSVEVIAPKRLNFLFEKKVAKWVDGADYEYYVLIGIDEDAPNN